MSYATQCPACGSTLCPAISGRGPCRGVVDKAGDQAAANVFWPQGPGPRHHDVVVGKPMDALGDKLVLAARIGQLEQQVAVLREAVDALLCAWSNGMNGPEAWTSGERALSTTQPTGWVRLVDVERVLVPLMENIDSREQAVHAHAAARAFLKEAKR